MENSLKNLLIELDNIPGVSGDETKVAEKLKEKMTGLYDEEFCDVLGNQFFVKYGSNKNKRIVFCAHMDEVGFIVRNIESNGMIRVFPVGYHDDRVCVNQRLLINTESGPVIGVTGSIPFHALDHSEPLKATAIQDLVIDIGAQSAEEARKLGVEIGDYASFEGRGEFLNNTKVYSGKSLDDRAGCAVLVEIMKQLQSIKHEATVYCVGTIQEEVGMRGGGAVAARLNPDLLIALDLTLSSGIPGMEGIPVSMGNGPAIKYYDWDGALGMTGNNVPRKLTRRLIEIAQNNNIPFQREVIVGGGTDAWSASLTGTGFLTGGISIPSQYMHTAVTTVHLDDVVNTTKLALSVINEF